MGENTKIEWANHTFNPWVGCTKVSPACYHCYAEGWAKRSGQVLWGAGNPRKRTSEANWKLPLRWNRDAEKTGVRPRVFCASLADVFDNEVPGEWRADLWAVIRETKNLDWLIVTKRISNAAKMLPEDWGDGWPNVWILSTVASQEEADRDIPKLLKIPAIVRGLSIEPMLSPIDLLLPSGAWNKPSFPVDFQAWTENERERWFDMQARATYIARCNCLDWIIVGGESGHNARPMNPVWVRSIRDQCQAAGVPFFFKQWGEWLHSDLCTTDQIGRHVCQAVPGEPKSDSGMIKVGKKAAGRILDGRTWDELPEV